MFRLVIVVSALALLIGASDRATASTTTLSHVGAVSPDPGSQIVVESRQHIWFFWNTIDGDQYPIRSIELPPHATNEEQYLFMVHDQAGDIFTFSHGGLVEYAKDAKGKAQPIWTASGARCVAFSDTFYHTLDCGLGIDGAGEIIATTNNGVGAYQPPNTSPVRVFTDSSILGGPCGFSPSSLDTVDSEVYTTDWCHNALLRYPVSSSGDLHADLEILDSYKTNYIVVPMEIRFSEVGDLYLLTQGGSIDVVPNGLLGGQPLRRISNFPSFPMKFVLGKFFMYVLGSDGNVYVFHRDINGSSPTPVRVIRPKYRDPRWAGSPSAIMLYP